jgi:two-component system, response regulator YesN
MISRASPDSRLPLRGKVFRKLFLVALLLATGPVFVLSVVGVHFVGRSAERIAEDYTSQNLAYRRTVLDRMIGDLRSVAADLSFSDEVWAIMRAGEIDTAGQLLVRELSRRIAEVRAAHPLLRSVYFFDERHDFVVKSLVKYPKDEFADSAVFEYVGANVPTLLPPRTVEGETVLTLVTPFDVFGVENRGWFVLNIDHARFFGELFPVEERFPVAIVVADSSGNLYYSTASAGSSIVERALPFAEPGEVRFRTVAIDGRDYFVSGVASRRVDLAIIHLQETAIVRAAFGLLGNILLLSMLALVGAAVALAALASSWVYRPLRSLLSDVVALTASDPGAAVDEYTFIGEELRRVLGRNEQLGEQIEIFAPLLREHLAGDMLKSGALGIGQLKTTLGVLGLRFPGRFFYALFADVEAPVPVVSVRRMLETRLAERAGIRSCLASVVSSSRLSVLLNTDENEASVLGIVSRVHGALGDAGIPSTMVISAPFERLDALPDVMSGLEARIDQKFFGGRGSMLLDDPQAPVSARDGAEIDVVGELVEAIKEGARARATEALAGYRRAFERGVDRSAGYARFSYFRLAVLVAESLSRVGIVDPTRVAALTDEAYRRTSNAASLDELEEYLCAVVDATTGDLARLRENRQHELVERAKAFAVANMARDVSLDEIAYAVRLSAGHLNALFREHADCTVIDYLNAQRVERAKELLRAGDQRVHEIARDVGYNSSQTFIRSFKRRTGVTPAQFRVAAGRSGR